MEPLPRFDIKLELKECDHYQMNQIYEKFLKRCIDDEILKRLPEDKITPSSFIHRISLYIYDNTSTDEEILQPFL